MTSQPGQHASSIGSARRPDGKFGVQYRTEDDSVRLIPTGHRVGFGGVCIVADDSPALVENIDVAPAEADAFNRSIQGGIQALSTAAHVVRPEYQTGYTIVRSDASGRGAPAFATYADSAWTRPDEAPLLSWRPPSGSPVAKVGLDGRVSYLDDEKMRTVAMGVTPRPDGRFDVDDSVEANELWGCPRDDECILHRGHLGDCSSDREQWVSAEDRRPGDLGYSAVDEDDLDFARETLGESANDEEVRELAERRRAESP